MISAKEANQKTQESIRAYDKDMDDKVLNVLKSAELVISAAIERQVFEATYLWSDITNPAFIKVLPVLKDRVVRALRNYGYRVSADNVKMTIVWMDPQESVAKDG